MLFLSDAFSWGQLSTSQLMSEWEREKKRQKNVFMMSVFYSKETDADQLMPVMNHVHELQPWMASIMLRRELCHYGLELNNFFCD